MKKKSTNRRQFIDGTMQGLTGAALGWTAQSALAQKVRGANDKVILALIGCGGRGSGITAAMARLEGVEVKCACEIDDSRGGDFIKEMNEIQGYPPKRVVDMREVFDDKDVDAVVIGTPEHWHALATVWACQAGKDVYVEKNISLTIWESRQMVEAARKYNRIVQCGTQNRSAPYAFSARDYIKSGKLGKIVLVKNYCLLSARGSWSPSGDSPTPEGLDWDRWLGPAPKVPYNTSRHRRVYNWFDYTGGDALAGDASHVIDLARMAIGDPEHPQSVYCAGGHHAYGDKNKQIPDIQAITYDYGDFVMTCESGTFSGNYLKKSPGDVRYGDKFPDWRQNGTRIEIYGTDRMMYLGRHGGGWQVFEGNGKVDDFDYGYHPDKFHQANFIDCIRTRKTPNGNIEQGHLSASLIHLGNLSYRAGCKQLLLDPKTESFTNSPEANQLARLEYRDPYRLPEKV